MTATSFNLYDLYQAPVNNAGFDPIQGFDVDCWVQDTASGQQAIFGKFRTITFSIQDTDEMYIEVGQRIPTYLNGQIQISWVLEQGMLDMDFLTRTFGIRQMAREQFIGRGPRFHISFDAYAPQVEHTLASSSDPTAAASRTNAQDLARLGGNNVRPYSINVGGTSNALTGGLDNRPRPYGRIELMRCKVNSISMGVEAGQRVAALRWVGVAEGYYVHSGTQAKSFQQESEDSRLGSATNRIGGGNVTFGTLRTAIL